SGLLTQTQLGLLGSGTRDLSLGRAQQLCGQLFSSCLRCAGPLLGVLFLVGLAACLAQVGFRPNLDLLGFRWSRISPFVGGRLLSWNNAVKGVLALLRVGVVGLLAWWVLRGQGPNVAALSEMPLSPAIARGWSIVVRLALAIAGGLLVLGIA